MVFESAAENGFLGDEDCLYLNVAAPVFAPGEVPAGEQRLPVMVWIHGGRNVYALLASSQAAGLYHRAIVQSGMPVSYAISEAEHYSDDPVPGLKNGSRELINRLLVADGRAADREQARVVQEAMDNIALREYLYSKPTGQLFAGIVSEKGAEYYLPTIIRDGEVIPHTPLMELLSDSGSYNAVPTIIGTNRDGMKSLMMMYDYYVERRFGVLPEVKDLETWDRDTGYVSRMWKVLGADEPARAMVAGGNDAVLPSLVAIRPCVNFMPSCLMTTLIFSSG